MRFARYILPLVLLASPAANLHPQTPDLDSLDAYIKLQMDRRRIPGLSIAIIHDGRVAVSRAYGVADLTTRAPATPGTLFQAGSISKPVAALGALHLVETGKLSLDEDVNAKLTTWRFPENGFTQSEKVTLRRLLSHSAGVTVHGFPGYDVADPIPDLVQVLNGAKPANTAPIRVDTIPGAIQRYSGGGFTVMQQLVIDVTGTPFPRYMQETVLNPIGMTTSSFEQPLSPVRARFAASGYYQDRSPVRGRWHIYPEMAAAGLWTTAADLARFVIEIQETLAGKGRGVISPAMAREYLTEQKGGSGLGIGVEGSTRTLRFSHGGRDEGFDAFLYGDAAGHGIVILINANDNSRFMGRIMDHVARTFGWPQETWMWTRPMVTSGIPIDSTRLAQLGGYYEASENRMAAALVPALDGSGIITLTDGLPDEFYLPIDSLRFGADDRDIQFTFVPGAEGEATAMLWRRGGGPERNLPRVAPLPSQRRAAPDPDAALTRRIVESLAALQQSSGAFAAAPGVTAGAKRAFAGGIGSRLEGMETPVYLGEENVAGRGIRRHGSDVARVRYYAVPVKAGRRYVLAHLTADGTVADFNIVDR